MNTARSTKSALDRPPLGARFRAVLLTVLALTVGVVTPAYASASSDDVQTAWRLLDYVAVDYRGAVNAGQVKSVTEYAEMSEFSATVEATIAALPPTAERPRLIAEAGAFRKMIANKAAPDNVAKAARALGAHLLAAYPVPVAPSTLPDLARGSKLYADNCASCHGLAGDGRGPDAAALDPPPVAFRDVSRARERSPFALYQVIGQGLDGTAMRSFAELRSQDRWALAFYASRFAFTNTDAGERLWKADVGLRKRIPDLASLAGLTAASLGAQIGQEKADSVIGFLRAHPEAVIAARPGSLALAHQKLQDSLSAYEAGDRQTAKRLALSAYLDGFEPVEPALAARDATLMGRIEAEMGNLRAAIGRGEPVAAVRSQVAVVDTLFTDAEEVLSPDAASAASTFIGAFTILLREGLEALLIIVAMIAFLRKADRSEMVRYVHGGWAAALIGGAITWAVATFFIGVSGASRELTEGFGSLFAAAVLLSVGIWMHGKSQAGEWQRYITETLGKALTRGSAWFMFGLAFVVAYREVFETILFYAALTTQGGGVVILAGAGSAIVALGLIAWAMLRFSATLPVSEFFKYSSALIAILAVVLAGKGVAALQEAGLIDIAPLSQIPRIPVLGLFPTMESIGAQLATVAVVALGAWYNHRLASKRAGAEEVQRG
ncbi:FTR1 family protein [Parablastomonas sp. CN1-191]|uniref:FTR1 family protein n=1 Tax=Parablastomonas sp. CN1-191 TaxID=3400908 RepID=UPI003BF8FBB2